MGQATVSFPPLVSDGAHRDTVFIFMRLIVNGEALEKSHAGTVMELLDELHIKKEQVAVEVNLSIIKKDAYETFKLHDGDTVEIVKFVGGG